MGYKRAVIRPGNGLRPKRGQLVTVKYVLKRIDNYVILRTHDHCCFFSIFLSSNRIDLIKNCRKSNYYQMMSQMQIIEQVAKLPSGQIVDACGGEKPISFVLGGCEIKLWFRSKKLTK